MKKIIHVDMDCFYAAVEMRDNPSLKGLPLAIGGSEKCRGVIATCNYEARKFGVKSAMATAHALKLCPTLTLIRADMAKYKHVSMQIRDIFSRYTTKIEPLSLDEAYLDVSSSTFFQGSATLIAQDIRSTIQRELALSASAGIASVKFIAKIASDLNKPNGQCVISPNAVDAFIKTLPLEKIPGVGKVTLTKLHSMGLYQGQDVQLMRQKILVERFGKFGQILWLRCHGIDEREVETERMRKSVAVEKTLVEDIRTKQQCIAVMNHLYDELEVRLKRACPDGFIAKQGVKIKFSDFQQTTTELKQHNYDRHVFTYLLEKAFSRRQNRAIRLIGLSVGLKKTNEKTLDQLSFQW